MLECSQDGWLELDAYYTGANRGRDPSDVMAPGAKPEGMTPSDSVVDLMHPQAHPRTLKTNPTDDGHGHAIRWLTSVFPCITTRSALFLLHSATRSLPGLRSRFPVHALKCFSFMSMCLSCQVWCSGKCCQHTGLGTGTGPPRMCCAWWAHCWAAWAALHGRHTPTASLREELPPGW